MSGRRGREPALQLALTFQQHPVPRLALRGEVVRRRDAGQLLLDLAQAQAVDDGLELGPRFVADRDLEQMAHAFEQSGLVARARVAGPLLGELARGERTLRLDAPVEPREERAVRLGLRDQ